MFTVFARRRDIVSEQFFIISEKSHYNHLPADIIYHFQFLVNKLFLSVISIKDNVSINSTVLISEVL